MAADDAEVSNIMSIHSLGTMNTVYTGKIFSTIVFQAPCCGLKWWTMENFDMLLQNRSGVTKTFRKQPLSQLNQSSSFFRTKVLNRLSDQHHHTSWTLLGTKTKRQMTSKVKG